MLYQESTKKTDSSNIRLEGEAPQDSFPKALTTDETELAGQISKRFESIRAQRNDAARIDEQLKQFNSEQFFLPDGRANINFPLERAVIETKLADELQQDDVVTLAPVGKDDVHKTKALKIVLDFVSQQANTDREKGKAYLMKSVFGWCGWFEGVITEGRYKHDVDGKSVYEEIVKLGGFAISPQDVYVDVTGEDAFFIERGVSMSALSAKKEQKDFKNIDLALSAGSRADLMTNTDKTRAASSATTKTYDLYHYYSLSGKYVILVDRQIVIYDGYLPYKHGQLPISILIDHDKIDSQFGVGECELLRPIKYELNTIRNQQIDSAKFSNQINLVTNNDVSFESYGVMGGIANIMRVNSNPVSDALTFLKPPAMDTALSEMNSQLMKDATIVTGVDPAQIIGSATKTAWESRAIEQNKLKRIFLASRNNNIFWQRVFTQRIANIQQFFKNENIFRSKIRVPNTDIEQMAGGGVRFARGSSDSWLDVTDSILACNVDVKVETPTTTSLLKEMQKTDFIDAFRRIYDAAVQTKSPSLARLVEGLDWKAIFNEQLLNIGYSLDDYATEQGANDADLRQEVLKNLPDVPSFTPFPTRQ